MGVQREDLNSSPITDDIKGICYLWYRKISCHKGPKSFEEMAHMLSTCDGTQFHSPRELSEALNIGLCEAAFLYIECDEDVEEDAEEELSREPQMRDLVPITASLAKLQTAFDELQKQQRYPIQDTIYLSKSHVAAKNL